MEPSTRSSASTINRVNPIFTGPIGFSKPSGYYPTCLTSKLCKSSTRSSSWSTVKSTRRPSSIKRKFIVDIIVYKSIYIMSILYNNFTNPSYQYKTFNLDCNTSSIKSKDL